MTRPLTVFHDGEFVAGPDVALPASTQGLHYGTGVFEGIRGYWNAETETLAVFRLTEHLERLQRSAAVLKIDLGLSLDELGALTVELARRNDCRRDTYFRPLAYKFALLPGTPFGVRLDGVSAKLTISALPMGSYVNQQGLRCHLSEHRRVPSACIPSSAKVTGMYVSHALAMQDAVSHGYDDAILLDVTGNVAEASTANVFAVLADGEVVTPPADADLLAGITRASIIELLRSELSVEVVQRAVTPAELVTAREVFLAGTGVEIAPVAALDNARYATGADTLGQRARQLYSDVVHGAVADYRHWLTPVHLD